MQTTTLTQRLIATNTACETVKGTFVTVAKATKTVDCELDETKKPKWTCAVLLSDLFSSGTTSCFFTYGVDWKTKDSTTSAVRAITKFTYDPANSKVNMAITETDSLLAGTAMGQHVLTVTAKTTAGVTYNPAKTATVTVRAYYKKCKAANIVSSVTTFSDKKLLLNAAKAT